MEASWWERRTFRLALLLPCLAGAVLALLVTRGPLGGAATAGAGTAGRECDGRIAANAATISPAVLAQLRGTVAKLVAPQVGREYEAGVVATSNLWSDDRPSAPAATSQTSGGYEIRWWALDREGREDDVVVDAIPYASHARAAATLALAGDTRCRREGSARASVSVPGGHLLSWVNPDAAYQQDILFVRGSTLYRVSDVPPGWGSLAAERSQRAAEYARLPTLVEALACSLPAAGCAPRAAARAALAAGAPALGPLAVGPRWTPTRSQAAAYSRDVAVRAYDVAEMRQVAPGREVPDIATASVRVNGACEPRLPRAHALAAAISPVFAARRGGVRQVVYSATTLLDSERAAAAYVSAISSAALRACELRTYRAAFAKPHVLPPRTRASAVAVAVVNERAPRPSSYRDDWRYRAAAVRGSVQLTYTTRRGRRVALHEFSEAFVFAFHRALVALVATGTEEPFPANARAYLEDVLVGRAESSWGGAR